MRGLIIGLISLAAVSASAQTIPPEGAAATLDVAAWNVEHFGNPGLNPPDAGQLENVRQVILQSGIDLWALEEVETPEVFDELVSSLGAGWEGRLDAFSNNLHVGLIFRSDVITRVRSVGNVLTGFADSFAGRPPLQLVADATVGDTTVTVTFIALHMKCCTDSWERRNDAGLRLKNHLDSWHSTANVVVLGDWNDELTTSITAGRNTPYERFLDDPANYRFLTLELDRAGESTWCGNDASCNFGSTIDHILISNELFGASIETDRYDALLSAIPSYVNTTSDHLPVYARFSFATDTAVEGPGEGDFAIRSIYPNPASSFVDVEYAVDSPSRVRVEVVDVLGRQVKVFQDAASATGSHLLRVETARLAPGPYVVLFSAGNRRAAGEFLVVH